MVPDQGAGCGPKHDYDDDRICMSLCCPQQLIACVWTSTLCRVHVFRGSVRAQIGTGIRTHRMPEANDGLALFLHDCMPADMWYQLTHVPACLVVFTHQTACLTYMFRCIRRDCC